MTILRIHHVQITVPPGKESDARRFYCSVLNLRAIDKPDALKDRGGFWVQVGDIEVHVGTEEDVKRRATRAHLAYEVDDLLQWRTRLETVGIRSFSSTSIPGYLRCKFRDPFGNNIELIQRVAQ